MLKYVILFSFFVAFGTAFNQPYTPCDPNCIDQATKDDLEKITIRYYFNHTIYEFTQVLIGNSLNLLDIIDRSKPCNTMFIFGWTGDLPPNRVYTEIVLSALLKEGRCNVFLLNWERISLQEYTFAARSVPAVAHTAATQFFNKLVAAGINISGLRLVGHSLGAQISGFIGKFVNFLFPRITGLDPAGPGFEGTNQHLEAADSAFTDVMHTDGGVLGMLSPVGHVDSFPNGGSNLQPGCLTSICSHYRACDYFAESVNDLTAFIGRYCGSYVEFSVGLCNSRETEIVGYGSPTDARGNLYFRTKAHSPYGQRAAGTSSLLLK